MILTLKDFYEHLGPGLRLFVTDSTDDLILQFCEACYYLSDRPQAEVEEVLRADRDVIYIRVKKG